MAKIKWKVAAPHILPPVGGAANGRMLRPGVNDIPDGEMELYDQLALRHKAFGAWLAAVEKDGRWSRVDASAPEGLPVEDLPSELGKYPSAVAKTFVKETSDVALLRKWLQSETRVGVRKAVETKIDKIQGTGVHDDHADGADEGESIFDSLEEED